MVHGMVGQPGFEICRERAARGFPLGTDFADFGLACRDQRPLAAAIEHRQSDRDTGRDVIAKPRIAVLIGRFDAEVRTAVGFGKSNIGIGLTQSSIGWSEQRV